MVLPGPFPRQRMEDVVACKACGHSWDIQQAHIISQHDGWMLVQCPRCGRVERVEHVSIDKGE